VLQRPNLRCGRCLRRRCSFKEEGLGCAGHLRSWPSEARLVLLAWAAVALAVSAVALPISEVVNLVLLVWEVAVAVVLLRST